jgi:uncharacterized protein (TIGR01619 family)
MKKIVLLLMTCATLAKMNAQQYRGNWDAYVMHVNSRPVSVVVDLDFGNAPEAREKRNVIIVRLNMQHVQPDGMPEKSEIKILDSLENSLVNTLSDALSAQYTGRYTQNGKRDFYFYSNDTSNCMRYVATALRPFSSYLWAVLTTHDAELSNYFNVLYPTPKEIERMHNRKMTDALRAKGDQLTAPRQVDHFLFFKSEAGRKSFARVVQDSGFVVENAGREIGIKDRPYSLHISRVDKVDDNSIDKVSLYLWELALRYSGKYDGWETFVVR